MNIQLHLVFVHSKCIIIDFERELSFDGKYTICIKMIRTH